VSIEKIANEYKEAQRDYLTRNSVTIIPKWTSNTTPLPCPSNIA
jgi:hypothetical protein